LQQFYGASPTLISERERRDVHKFDLVPRTAVHIICRKKIEHLQGRYLLFQCTQVPAGRVSVCGFRLDAGAES